MAWSLPRFSVTNVGRRDRKIVQVARRGTSYGRMSPILGGQASGNWHSRCR